MNRRTIDRKTFWLAVLFLTAFLCGAAGSGRDNSPQTPPLNPDFLKYLNEINEGALPPTISSDQYPVGGGNPAPADMSHVTGVIDQQVIQTYPPSYDLREHNKISSFIKEQEGFSCWMHAAINSLESNLMPDEVRNFDAEYLDKYWNHGFTQPLGGDYREATACLVRWSGPMEDPKEKYTYWRVGKFESIQKHVQQVVYLPNRNGPLDNDTAKWFIMNHGAIYGSMHYSDRYFNHNTYCYYLNGDRAVNHAIAIIGWDDNYDRSNFIVTPPGNGAFIGRMSWGKNWGDRGCFYVSYYDTVLTVNAAFNNAEPVDKYGTLYQYDPLGAVIPVGRNSTVYWGANVFTASDNLPLEAVGFYTTDSGVTYDIHIYKNVGTDGPTRGIMAASQSGGITYPGYYTVKLDTPVPVTPGERFSVVIRFANSNYIFPVAIEKPIESYSHKATANPGESFVSKDGLEWDDLTLHHPNSNVCIKAYSAPPDVPKPIISCRVWKEVKKMWAISKIYIVVSINLENSHEFPAWFRLAVYRELNNGVFENRKNIPGDELQDGSFTLYDESPEEGIQTNYHITAYDSTGSIIGRSTIQHVL